MSKGKVLKELSKADMVADHNILVERYRVLLSKYVMLEKEITALNMKCDEALKRSSGGSK